MGLTAGRVTRNDNGTWTISDKRYEELLEAEAQLTHLNALGVDNWEGYSYYSDDDEDWEDDD